MSKVTDEELHAYVDGLLPEARRDEVAAYLRAHPEAAERVRIYSEQNVLIKERFSPVMTEPAPEWLLPFEQSPAVGGAAQRRWFSSIVLRQIAASVLMVGLGAVMGWMARGAGTVPDRTSVVSDTAMAEQGEHLARRAATAHVVYSPDVRRPVEIEAAQEDQLIAWLSKRLGASVRPPKLAALGYELIGGRLLPGAQGPVAQFMYHDTTGQRLTLYVSNEHRAAARTRHTGFRFMQEGAVNVFYWIDGDFGYALSAGTDKQALARVAIGVHDQLAGQAGTE